MAGPIRVRVFSDLHLEFEPIVLPQVDADVVILAGDTGRGTRGAQWAVEAFPGTPVVYVAGNHEFYGGAYPSVLEKLRLECAGTDVHPLECGVACVGGVTFLGCTLWTDFELFENAEAARGEARARMNDYRVIRHAPSYRRFNPSDTVGVHLRSLRWLREQAAARRHERLVIVTHHAPSARSLNPLHADSLLNAAYASRLDEFVQTCGAELWVHGHTHFNVDYRAGRTRVFSNQRGYPDAPVDGFNAEGILEL